MTTIIASTNIGGAKVAAKIKKMWPLRSDNMNPVNVVADARKIIDRMREREALNKANEKVNARGSKNTGRGKR